MRDFSIGPIAGLFLKPRYSSISTFLGEEFNPVNGFDIFIDLNSLVSALSTSKNFLNSLPFSNEDNVVRDIISNVLSILKHWKDFSRRYDDVRIFMIVNEFEMGGLPEQEIIKSYLAPYTNKFKQDRYRQMVYYWTESMNKISAILKYVPKSYLIRCNRLDSFIIPNIIDDYSKNGRFRFIISSSSMMTMYMLEPNTKVELSKYKHQMVDPSMIVQNISNINNDIMKTFITNKVFYALLNMVIGDFDRGLIGITQLGISSFANDLLRAVERNEIPKDPKTIDSILPIINSGYHEYLRKGFKLVDIKSHADLIPQSIIEKIKSTMEDVYDIDGLSGISIDGMNLIELL